MIVYVISTRDFKIQIAELHENLIHDHKTQLARYKLSNKNSIGL
jgi:hypothetical protein